jgi:hypothetical protein
MGENDPTMLLSFRAEIRSIRLITYIYPLTTVI